MTDAELRRHEHAALRAAARALLAAQFPDLLWSRLTRAEQRRYLTQARDAVMAYLFRAADSYTGENDSLTSERRMMLIEANSAHVAAYEMGCR